MTLLGTILCGFIGPEFLKDSDFLSNHLQYESFENDLFSDDIDESYLREM